VIVVNATATLEMPFFMGIENLIAYPLFPYGLFIEGIGKPYRNKTGEKGVYPLFFTGFI
jgi:hypothetical protein